MLRDAVYWVDSMIEFQSCARIMHGKEVSDILDVLKKISGGPGLTGHLSSGI